MIKKILFILFILVLAVGFVSAANETNDNLTLSNNNVHSFDKIQKDVNNAKNNAVINLDGNYKSSGKQITVSKSLTFSGSKDTVLDARHKSNIFYVSKPVTVTFKNIKFLNAKDFSIGTDYSQGRFKINIINCTFKNNGLIAVEAYSSNLKVENSVFENNYQAIQDYDHVVIDNCRFIRNSYVAIQASDATISHSSFISNGNNGDGLGAVDCYNLKITDSEFISNIAYESGGAIHAYDAGQISISNSRFIKNTAKYLGGAIYMEDNSLYLNQCSFVDNSAIDGAAIYSRKSLINAFNSNFTGNRASYAIICSNYNARFTNVTFKDNQKFAVIASKVDLINCNNISKNFNQWACLDDNLNNSNFIRISLNKINTDYTSGKKLTVKLINTLDNSVVGNCKVKVILKTDRKTYTKYLTTNSKGIASFDISRYRVDRYNLRVSVVESSLAKLGHDEIGIVSIYQYTPNVKAPKVKFKFKKSKYFKVTIKHRKTKKPIKNLKLKLKVYTGKKYKIYKIKTNKKGVAKLNTKRLKRGGHRVIITSLNKNYYIKKQSTIKIR